jgi:hypothetical protein
MKKFFAGLTVLALAGCAAQPRTQAYAPAVVPPSPTVPIPPAPPKGEPDLFTGIDAARLRALVGAPVFSRKDGVFEMWRYDAGACHAYFFLTGAPAKVQHVETLPRGKTSAADPECLSALRSSAKPS